MKLQVRCGVAALLTALTLSGTSTAPAQNTAVRRIEIGWAAPIARLEAAKAAGFDYVEVNASDIAGLSEQAFDEALSTQKRLGMPTPVANVFIPRDQTIPVSGPNADPAKQMAYVRPLFDRLAKLGVNTLVFGGGKQVPEGWTEEGTFRQLIEFSRRITPEAKDRGITIVIEPTSESNFIRTVSEGLRMMDAVNDPSMKLMVDYYHVAVTKEDPAVIVKAGQSIRHVHIANPQGRVFPLSASESDYSGFFEALKRIGYRGRVTIEGGTKDLNTEAPVAIAFLRRSLAP